MKLDFIQSELTEARLFQGPKDLKKMSASDIGGIIYLMIMALEVIRYSNPGWAASYAADTVKYYPYENMHYAGSDLANLLAVLNNQDTFKHDIKVDKNISIPLFQINRYLSDVRSGRTARSNNEDAQFFWRLEDYLKAYSNSQFRFLRRVVGEWDDLTRADKIQIEQIIRSESQKKGSSADIFLHFRSNYKLKESINEYADFNHRFEYHDTLNPALWDERGELHLDVKEALGKIANKFSEFVDIGQLKITDYIITGSNCAFNYTSKSDIDLHVLVDASALGDNPLTEPFLLAKKSLWNSGHDITVKGYTVELYAEDIHKEENKLVATGIYSLLYDKWIKQPQHEQISVNDFAVSSKAEDIMSQIESILRDPAADINDIKKLWAHLKNMRSAGLEKGGEFSVENLAYKAVRNSGYFDKLSKYEHDMEDTDLTLEHTDGLVDESFDSQVQGKLVRATDDLFTTKADIGGRTIVFNATSYIAGRAGIFWEVDFSEKTANNGTTFAKTGGGGEMQVFSFVIESIKELIARYKPDAIEFSSHKADGNRSKLYQRMIQRIKIPGYHAKEMVPGEVDDHFSIIRDN
jgi:hypothetical protein